MFMWRWTHLTLWESGWTVWWTGMGRLLCIYHSNCSLRVISTSTDQNASGDSWQDPQPIRAIHHMSVQGCGHTCKKCGASHRAQPCWRNFLPEHAWCALTPSRRGGAWSTDELHTKNLRFNCLTEVFFVCLFFLDWTNSLDLKKQSE